MGLMGSLTPTSLSPCRKLAAELNCGKMKGKEPPNSLGGPAMPVHKGWHVTTRGFCSLLRVPQAGPEPCVLPAEPAALWLCTGLVPHDGCAGGPRPDPFTR